MIFKINMSLLWEYEFHFVIVIVLSSVTFSGVWGSHGTLDQHIDRPTQFRCPWPQNRLPPALRLSELSLSSFKRQLKTHSSSTNVLVVAVTAFQPLARMTIGISKMA